MVESTVELVHGVRAESIAYLWAVECNANNAVLALCADMAVVSDIGEIKAGDFTPL